MSPFLSVLLEVLPVNFQSRSIVLIVGRAVSTHAFLIPADLDSLQTRNGCQNLRCRQACPQLRGLTGYKATCCCPAEVVSRQKGIVVLLGRLRKLAFLGLAQEGHLVIEGLAAPVGK